MKGGTGPLTHTIIDERFLTNSNFYWK